MKKLVERTRKVSFRVILIILIGLFSSVCFAQPAAPNVNVEIVNIDDINYVRVRWEAVEGAASYNIYASETANPEEWGDPIATVGADVFEYDVPVSDERVRLFYVTASDAPPGMVFVQGGTFNPTHHYTVNLSSFYISRYEVTQSKWTSVMGGIYDPNWPAWCGQGPNYPAYNISWFDAIEYCNRLSMRVELDPVYSYIENFGEENEENYGTDPDNWPAGWSRDNDNHTNVFCNWNLNGYRLPTEMEREFAARGGVSAQQAGTFNDRWPGTDVEGQLVNYAWYIVNSNWRTYPVCTKLPNELGLYDMSGNVANLVWDIYADYPTGIHDNPTGPTNGTTRIMRGGAWTSHAIVCRVNVRDVRRGAIRSDTTGFRVARNLN